MLNEFWDIMSLYFKDFLKKLSLIMPNKQRTPPQIKKHIEYKWRGTYIYHMFSSTKTYLGPISSRLRYLVTIMN